MIDGWARDLRLAARRLIRSPGFTVTAVATLALGIGANTTMFTLADASLLRPLPFPDADRLAVLWERQQAQGKDRAKTSAENFLDWRAGSRTFAEMAAWIPWGLAFTGTGEPEELPAVRASANLFRLLNVKPAVGRGFLAEEETPGRDRVVILSHALWTRRFGADSSAVGRTVVLDGEPYQIVGVMPAGFRFPGDAAIALWTPLAFSAHERATRAERMFSVIGRLAPRVTLDQARGELGIISHRLAAAYPKTNAGWDVSLVSASEAAAAGGRRALLMLLGSVGLVLLIACGNVGHLMLARVVGRDGEIALRVALGAAPSRLIRLLLIESGMVATLGAAFGAAMAMWTFPLIQASSPGVLAGWREPNFDGRVLIFTGALLLFVTLACGLLPALRWMRRGPPALAEAGAKVTTGFARSRLRQGLIVGQIALSVVLLVATGLLLRSLERLSRVDPGFNPDHVVAATIFLSSRYPDRTRQAAFFDQLVARLEGVQGVEAVGAVTTLPMNPVGIDYDLPFSADGRAPGNDAEREQVDFRSATPDYFRALGVPLLQGRWFALEDREDSAPVVIVNQPLVHRYYAGTNPVGRQVWIGGGIGKATVVGIVGAVHHHGLDVQPRPEMYVPFRQYIHGGMTVVVRAAGDLATLMQSIKAQVFGLDPNQPVTDVVTLPQLLADSVSPRRFTLLLLGSFAVFALVLAGIGVYGVVAYTVSQRTREIGIRIALGARTPQIRRAVARPGLLLAGVGVVLGSALGWTLTRLLGAELYEVSPHDPATFAASAAVILAVAWVACELPALRARRIDPVIALRAE